MKSRQTARSILLLALFAILFGYIGCSKSTDYNSPSTPAVTTGSQGANEVFIKGSAFSPATLTVAVNTTVKWTNKDSFPHTVTSDSPLFNSRDIAGNGSYSFQFTTKGTYPYHCSIHTIMTGTIIVQ